MSFLTVIDLVIKFLFSSSLVPLAMPSWLSHNHICFMMTRMTFSPPFTPRVISVGDEGYFKSAEHAYQCIHLRRHPGIRPCEIFMIEDEDNA